jgi:hypothetical protein
MPATIATTIGETSVVVSGSTTTITVSGTATPKTNLRVWVETLAGIPVSGSEQNTTSDGDGNFSVVLSFPTPPEGDYNVCVQELEGESPGIARKRVRIATSE